MIAFANFVGVASNLTTLAVLTIGATVLLIIACLASIVLRKKSAAVRYCIWQFAIAGLLMMPALYFVLPGWSFGISLPLFAATGERPSIVISDRVATAISERPAVPLKGADQHTPMSPPSLPPASSTAVSSTRTESIDPEPQRVKLVVATEPTSRPSSTSFSWKASLVGAWIMGIMIQFLWIAVCVVRSHRLSRDAIPTDDMRLADWLAASQHKESRRTEVNARLSLRITVPVVVGIWRPAILLPADFAAWTDEKLQLVLSHELAHVERRDILWQLVSRMTAALYWPHPLIWFALNQMKRYREQACDDHVLRQGVPAADYAAGLVEVAASLAGRKLRLLGSIGMAERSQLSERIESILKSSSARNPASLRLRALFVAIATCVAIMFAAVRPFGARAVNAEVAEPKPVSGNAIKDAPKSPNDRRPDGNKSEKEMDDSQAGQMAINAVSEESNAAIQDLKIEVHGRVGGKRFDLHLTTDTQGKALVKWPPTARIQSLWMTCSKVGFVPIHYTWRNDVRSIEMPDRLDLRFQKGIEIGGIVQGETGEPIKDAKVTITMPVTWPRLQSHVFYAAELTTDEQGHWSWPSAPADMAELGFSVEHADYMRGGGRPSATRDYLTTLKKGLIVTGRVLDSEGRPVKGAAAKLGFDRFGTDEPETKTDANGQFTLKKCKPGKSLVTVQANTFSPEFREITIGDENAPLEFKLQPGHALQIRVVDVEGKPIKGAICVTDTWRGYRTLELRSTTDKEGCAQWFSAPSDAVLCDVLHTGHMAVRKTPLQAGDEQVIVMHPELVVRGTVTDAVTGKPIPAFQVRRGARYNGQREVYWSRDEGTKYKDGKYSFKFDEPSDGYKLQAVASGYLPAESRQFASNEGGQTFDFKLQPGSGPTGTVVNTAGEPVNGADVGLATAEQHAMLEKGRFSRRQNSALIAKTDAEGKFTFAPQGDEKFLLIVAHESGFAEMTRTDFEKSHRIVLKPWGTLEGEVKVGDRPDPDREVSYWPKRPEPGGMYVFDYGYTTRTDKNGRFRFDRAIPGSGVVSRVVVTEFLKTSQHATCWQTPVEIKPGQSTKVTVGGTGRPVVGQLKLDRSPGFPLDWTLNEPVAISKREMDASTGQSTYVRFMANIDKSGQFAIPDVPAGKYEITVHANNPPRPDVCGEGEKIGKGTLEFTVPEMPGSRSDEPLDVGTITVTLFDTLDAGEVAPEFVAEKLAGGSLRLSDFSGKLVLIDFWATWCQPCLAEMPTFEAIQSQFGDDPRFVLLSISCDNQIDAPRDHVAKAGYGWQQGFVQGMQSRVPVDYTVRSLPATYLIGPDGRVIAKGLRGDALKQAVAAALKNEESFKLGKASRPVRFPVVRFETAEKPVALAEKPAVVVLDDIDPEFGREQPRHDRLRLLTETGKELWVHNEFNNCQTVGGVHGVAMDARRQRIYARENVSNRLIALNFHGKKLWQAERVEASAIAVDPKTGNLWVTGGPQLNVGETVVFDSDGNEIAAFPYCGIDIDYDPHTDSFWLAGYEIIKVNREGKPLFRQPVEGWCSPSVSVNPTNGSIWTIERSHPDVSRSKSRALQYLADGSVKQMIELGEFDPFAVACDPKTGNGWVTGIKRGLIRITPNGEQSESFPIQATNMSFSPTTGEMWATTSDNVVRIHTVGKVLRRLPFGKESGQAWLQAF